MAVVLESDYAKLVLDYLQDQQLEEAYVLFFKTSPHLKEAYGWFEKGYRTFKLHHINLVDIIKEYEEIDSLIIKFIETLPPDMAEEFRGVTALKKKIDMILRKSIFRKSPRKTPNMKRRRSTGSSDTCPQATQIKDLPGFDPLSKRQRLSNRMLHSNDSSFRIANTSHISSIKMINPDDSIHSNEDQVYYLNENFSDDRIMQYPIFSETILENTDFQNVLVSNMNKILDVNTGVEKCGNKTLQEQITYALDNIIMSTEQDPMFEEILNECVQSTAHSGRRKQLGHASSTPNNSEESDGGSSASIPIKQRLRNQNVMNVNYVESSKKVPKRLRNNHNKDMKVKVISNEPFVGKLPDVTERICTTNTDSATQLQSLPQVYILNSNQFITTQGNTSDDQEPVFINVPSMLMTTSDGVPIPFLITTPSNGLSALEPNALINNIPVQSIVSDHAVSEIASHANNIVKRDKRDKKAEGIPKICTENETNLINKTPKASSQMIQLKAKSLSTPRRRSSHVRVLNFNTPANPTDNGDNTKLNLNLTEHSVTMTPNTTCNTTIASSAPPKINNSKSLKTPKTKLQGDWDSVHGVGAIVRTGKERVSSTDKNIDETTVLSADLSIPETPKLLKNKRKNSGRVLSTDKKANAKESKITTRSRSVKTKKPKKDQKEEVKEILEVDPLNKWKSYRSINKNEWDQHLRIENKDDNKRRPVVKRKKKQKIVCVNKDVVKLANDSVEVDKSTDLEAKLLEEAIKSAKKPTVALEEPQPSPKKENPKSVKKRKAVKSFLIKLTSPLKKSKKKTAALKRQTLSAKKTKAKVKPVVKTECEVSVDKSIIQEQEPILNPHVRMNIATLLETPYKVDTSNIPPTPRFAIPPTLDTPVVKIIKSNNDQSSLIKFPEYPTPNFPITPGITTTPLSKTGSPRSGAYSNRPTDYSSGSSYYKPDESDDVDKNLDAIIRTGRIREQQLNSQIKQEPLKIIDVVDNSYDVDVNCRNSSDSSSNSSETSSSSSSSSTSCETTREIIIENKSDDKVDVDQTITSLPNPSENREKINEEIIESSNKLSDLEEAAIKAAEIAKQLADLEQTRLRTMQKLKSKQPAKPKPTISFAERKTKILVARKQITAPPQSIVKPVKIQSKRKIATPRKVIYLDNQMPSTSKTSGLVNSEKNVETNAKSYYGNKEERRDTEHLISDSSDNATTLDTFKRDKTDSEKNVESLEAIQSHIIDKASVNTFEEFLGGLVVDKVSSTPQLLNDLEGDKEMIFKIDDIKLDSKTIMPQNSQNSDSMSSESEALSKLFKHKPTETIHDDNSMPMLNTTPDQTVISTASVVCKISLDNVICNEITAKEILSEKKLARLQQERELFGDTTMSDNDTPVKNYYGAHSQSTSRIENISPRHVEPKTPISIVKPFSTNLTSTPTDSVEPNASDNKIIATSSNPITTEKPNVSLQSSDTSDSEEEDVDPYDECVVSLANSTDTNRCFLSISYNIDKPAEPSQPSKILTTCIILNKQKIQLSVVDEYLLLPDVFPKPVLNSDSKSNAVELEKINDTTKINLNKDLQEDKNTKENKSHKQNHQQSTSKVMPKMNLKYKKPVTHSLPSKKCIAKTKTVKKAESADQESPSKNQTKIQQNNRDIDINLVLRQVHPLDE